MPAPPFVVGSLAGGAADEPAEEAAANHANGGANAAGGGRDYAFRGLVVHSADIKGSTIGL
jgi:hypothetical protein